MTFEQMHGKKNIGSSRIRADWLIEKWGTDERSTAERFKQGGKYDVVIFQKAYWLEYAKAFKGIKILDLCDPDWLDWNTPLVQMIQEVDAITCSTQAICDFVSNLTEKPVKLIKDRINLDTLPKNKKQHVGTATKIAWFGYDTNQAMLSQAIPVLIEKKMSLVVISNKPYHLKPLDRKNLELKNYAWGKDTVDLDLLTADIVINPKKDTGKWKYKSDNKTIHAWSLGIPVAHNDTELKSFMSEESRKKESEKRLEQVYKDYDVLESVEEMKNLIYFLHEGI